MIFSIWGIVRPDDKDASRASFLQNIPGRSGGGKMQYIQVKELLSPPWNLAKIQIYDLVQSGLKLFLEKDRPLLPMRFGEAIKELAIWQELLKAKESGLKETPRLGLFMRQYGFEFNRYGWPEPIHRGMIQGVLRQPPVPPTIDDAREEILELTTWISEQSANPWKNPEISILEDQIEQHRILDAWARTEEVRSLLPESHPLAAKPQVPTAQIEESSEKADGNAPFPCPACKWEDVHITLVSNEMVRIQTPNGSGRFTFCGLGLQDRRKGDADGKLWGLLKILCKGNGKITSKTQRFDRTLPDTVKRLNKKLQDLFQVHESVFFHYKKFHAYIAKINFSNETISPEFVNESESE